MVLTAAQVTAFFTGADQMALPAATFAQLALEGITSPDDLTGFDKDTMKTVADNLRNPGGRIPNPDPNAPPGSTIARPPFVFGAKSNKRLLEACDLIRFYETIGRPLTAANILYNPIIRNFAQQWKALKERKDNDPPEVPKVSKALPIIKWTEAFVDYCNRKIGSMTIPLSYVIRENVPVPGPVPALAADLPHSRDHGSVEADLIARASHAHPLFRDDNAEVYFDLEKALRSTSYLASIKPFQRGRNGRDAFIAVCNQYAGEYKWQAELQKQEEIVHNRVWKGQGNYTLDRFVAQHRNAFIMMQECAVHVPYQLPNQFTRVTHLLDNIQCDYAPLQAAMALVRNDRGPTGKMNNFEDTASFIIPHDPVSKKRPNKRDHSNISSSEAKDNSSKNSEISISSASVKPSTGKTGVEFRFYKKREYKELTAEQKSELWKWQQSNKKVKSPGEDKAKTKTKSNTNIASAVAKELERQKEAEKTEMEVEENFQRYIMSIIANTKKSTTSGNDNSSDVPKVTINSILKRAKR